MVYKKIILSIIFLIGVIILYNSDVVFAYNSYNFGDKIRFRGNNYYVIEESNSDKDYIYLMRENTFSVNEINAYAKDEEGNLIISSLSNSVEFYYSDKCKVGMYGSVIDDSGCTADYKKSSVKKILDNWKNEIFEEDELASIDGYEVKTLTLNDIMDKFYFEEQQGLYGQVRVGRSSETPSFLPSNFWLMDISNDSIEVNSISSDQISSSKVYNKNNILPTVYLKKCALEGTCGNKSYNNYTVGEKVKFRGNNYYVIENSNTNQNFVTVIKEEPLNINDIQSAGVELNGEGNSIPYDSQNCNGTIYPFDYNNSYVKELIDNWANVNFYDGELKRLKGYKARILSPEDEIINNININSSLRNILDSVPFRIGEDGFNICRTYGRRNFKVYPVVNLKKCTIEGTCATDKKEEYSFGDLITYKGQNYHVLKNSDKYTNYVTLLKDEPLNKEELVKYYGGNPPSINVDENGVASIIYNYGQNNSYVKSNVKRIVDNWANDTFSSSLVYNDKYSAKLLSTEDLVNYLYYEWGAGTAGTSTAYMYKRTDKTPSWFYENSAQTHMWLMTPFDDSNNRVWTTYNDQTIDLNSTYEYGTVRPVVNVNKCELNPNADSCQKCKRVTKSSSLKTYKSYGIGDIVTYKGQEYYVVRNSNKYTSYLKLLKKEPLTSSQINQYGKNENNESIVNKYTFYDPSDITNNKKNGKFVIFSVWNDYNTYICNNDSDRICGSSYDGNYGLEFYYNTVIPGNAYQYDNGYGGMQYFSNDTCHVFNGKTYHINDETTCSNASDYELSSIKTVVDNWTKLELDENDLIKINNYNSRLISNFDIRDVIYDGNVGKTPKMIFPDNYSYWLMNAEIQSYPYEINSYGVNSLNVNDTKFEIIYPAVRPLIYLNKCALEDGCFTENINLATCYVDEEEIIEDPTDEPEEPSIIEDPNDPSIVDNDPDIIDAPNTSKIISIGSIILSISLIIGGSILVIHNVIKNKNNK